MAKLKMAALLLVMSLMVAGCGSTLDLRTTPEGVAAEKGIDAALAWCEQRDRDVAALGGARAAAGALFDLSALLASAPVTALTGDVVVSGTTAVRDKQCSAIRAEYDKLQE